MGDLWKTFTNSIGDKFRHVDRERRRFSLDSSMPSDRRKVIPVLMVNDQGKDVKTSLSPCIVLSLCNASLNVAKSKLYTWSWSST